MPNYNLGLSIESVKAITRMFLDIMIMWLLLYYAIKIVRNSSRTIQIFKGIILLLLVDGIAKFLGLSTVVWIADMFVNWGFLAVIIVFQPEIRSILERLGKSNVFSRILSLSGNEKEQLVDELVTATMLLSRDQVGALISLEQVHSLTDYIKTGTTINAVVSAELLTSLFVTTTPLHDGAVIIQGDRIACASAYFPPTNLELPTRYGARHRAAIGISEITDSVTIVVSEETGGVSIAEGGKIISVNRQQLKDYLMRVICGEETELRHSFGTVIPDFQKTIVDEALVADKKADTKFNTSMLSKLAIKKQLEAEEETEKETSSVSTTNSQTSVKEVVVETKVEPLKQIEPKRTGFLGGLFSKKTEHVVENEEKETHHEDEIKMPRRKEMPLPPVVESVVSEESKPLSSTESRLKDLQMQAAMRKQKEQEIRLRWQQEQQRRAEMETMLAKLKESPKDDVVETPSSTEETFNTGKIDLDKIIRFEEDGLGNQLEMLDRAIHQNNTSVSNVLDIKVAEDSRGSDND